MLGNFDGRDAVVDISLATGDPKAAHDTLGRNNGNVVIGKAEVVAAAREATIDAEAWVAETEAAVRHALLSAISQRAQHKIPVNVNQLALQAGQVVRQGFAYVEADAAEFAGRPMKIRNKDKWLAWQRERAEAPRSARKRIAKQISSPRYQRWLNRLDDRTVARHRRQMDGEWKRYIEGKRTHAPQRMTSPAKNRTMRTGRVSQYNQGILKQAQQNPAVVYLQFTTQRDSGVCSTCSDHDLWVVKKADGELAFRTPPLHPNCRCYMMQVTRAAAKKYGIALTPKRQWPKSEPAPGYGGKIPLKQFKGLLADVDRQKKAALKRARKFVEAPPTPAQDASRLVARVEDMGARTAAETPSQRELRLARDRERVRKWRAKKREEERKRKGLPPEKPGPAPPEPPEPMVKIKRRLKDLPKFGKMGAKAWGESLSEAETRALQSWVDDGYVEIRNLQRNRTGAYSNEQIAEYRQRLKTLDAALAKSASYTGVAYRGLGARSRAALDRYVVGGEITLDAHGSASYQQDVAATFSSRRAYEHSVMFKIKLRGQGAGTSFEGLAHSGVDVLDEGEILLRKGARLRIVKVRENVVVRKPYGEFDLPIKVDRLVELEEVYEEEVEVPAPKKKPTGALTPAEEKRKRDRERTRIWREKKRKAEEERRRRLGLPPLKPQKKRLNARDADAVARASAAATPAVAKPKKPKKRTTISRTEGMDLSQWKAMSGREQMDWLQQIPDPPASLDGDIRGTAEWLNRHIPGTEFHLRGKTKSNSLSATRTLRFAREMVQLARENPGAMRTLAGVQIQPKAHFSSQNTYTHYNADARIPGRTGAQVCIELNARWFSLKTKARDDAGYYTGFDNSVRRGALASEGRLSYHPRNCTQWESVVTHEFGHHVQYHLWAQTHTQTLESNWIVQQADTLTRDLWKEGKTVSQYAGRNEREAWAETFAMSTIDRRAGMNPADMPRAGRLMMETLEELGRDEEGWTNVSGLRHTRTMGMAEGQNYAVWLDGRRFRYQHSSAEKAKAGRGEHEWVD